MEKELIVLSADSVDRYGNIIHIKALEMMLKDRMTGGIPLLLGHDQSKPIGWGHPFALYLEPNLTRLLGIQFTPTNVEEKNLIINNHKVFRSNRYLNSSKEHINNFIELLNTNGITDYKFTNIACLTANRKNITRIKFAFLFESNLRDELVPLVSLLKHFEYLGNGIFKDKNSEFSIFAHRFFRKSESIHNTLNGIFLNELINLNDELQLDIYLRIDDSQLGYAPSYSEYMELEYQWGPQYSDDIETIKEGISRHDCNEMEKLFYGFSRSEFLWEWNKERNKFSFQMEELMDTESPENDLFNCRYVHTVYDKSKGDLEHFDGALRTYDTFEMINRLDKSIKSYGKQSKYTKLFKVNGKLPISKWKLLVTLYLRSNPIIYEYYGLKKEIEELSIPKLREVGMDELLMPYAIKEEEGLRIMVSYHNVPENLKEGRFVDSFDLVADFENTYKCIDSHFFEFKKSLNRLGGNINLPDEIMVIKNSDDYWNLPLIMHYGKESRKLLDESVEALKILISSLTRNGSNLRVSFTLGMVISKRIVRVSVFGHINSLEKWIGENLPFPSIEEDFTKWLSQQRRYLEKFPHIFDSPMVSELAQFDGVLFIKRKLIRSEYSLKAGEKGLEYSINFNEDEFKFHKESGCQIAPAYEIIEWVCSDTKEDYFKSPRSKWLDDDLPFVEITHSRPVALFWTRFDD
jgi:hypothetical protein